MTFTPQALPAEQLDIAPEQNDKPDWYDDPSTPNQRDYIVSLLSKLASTNTPRSAQCFVALQRRLAQLGKGSINEPNSWVALNKGQCSDCINYLQQQIKAALGERQA